MRNESIALAIAVAVIVWLSSNIVCAHQQESSDITFTDEPAAHAIYDKMIETMRKAKTLYYKSDFRIEAGGKDVTCTYTVWMKKPNYFRVETINSKGEKGGTIIGDGNDLWIYWSGVRPRFWWEDVDDYEKTHSKVYMKKTTPIGRHSIGHNTALLGGGMDMPIIDPSTFHGYTDTLQPHIDGVKSIGTEKIGDQQCNVIEVSYMNRQRIWYLWLSKKDNLPRQLKEVVHVNYDIITYEVWSEVTVNDRIPADKFSWTPPVGWKLWERPSKKKELPKPGELAAGFDLPSIDGNRIKLSDYRGKVVWLNIWRVGCPPCREEMPYLEKLYNKFRNKGFVVLGLNYADEKKFAKEFIREHSVTFPNICDTSSATTKTAFRDYKASGGVPVNFIIDRKGKITAAWYGYSKDDTKGIEALKKLGIK